MRFICDSMLGNLAKHLRILGLDTVSIKDPYRLEPYKDAADLPFFFTKRTKAFPCQPFIFIRSDTIEEQLNEIRNLIQPFINPEAFMKRCIECNTLLESVAKEDIEAHVPEYVYHHHEGFKRCPSCKKVYWEGTHTKEMKKWIEYIRALK
ncbi:MAG: hypothetical protein C0399_05835 [Syntrophus sp. (in: bacteria)]|nr:hypothetical protein [Syntrophus sp. (in: bacteria)]